VAEVTGGALSEVCRAAGEVDDVANDNSPGGPSGRPASSDGPAADEQEDIVVTPGGPRPRRLVTGVGPGQAVHFTDRGGQVV